MIPGYCLPSPRTDYNFQSMNEPKFRGPGSESAGKRGASFREISREFLRSETPRHFVVELLLFGAIVAVSAWPLLALAEALRRLIE